MAVDDFQLSGRNADPHNWNWADSHRASWSLADEDWENFRTRWHGAIDFDPKASSMNIAPLSPLGDHAILSTILVRESYATMFDRIWKQAKVWEGRTGAIITGQPGTGKTLFQYYFLVRLLLLKQVVLFSPNGEDLYLFYHDNVYESGTKTGLRLPRPKPTSGAFIWSLFDVAKQEQPAQLLINQPCLPVQTASPNPNRYQSWYKAQLPLFTGLPLWTPDELAEGLALQTKFKPLCDALTKVYGGSSRIDSPSLADFPGIPALLQEYYGEEGTEPPSPDEALNYLLQAAIERFGYSARDVFHAVFNYQAMTKIHLEAFNISYTALSKTVTALAANQSTDPEVSHRIFALSPVYMEPSGIVNWTVNFKSDWVARSVIRRLQEKEGIEIRQHISFLRSIPEAKGLAGRLLEPVAHRIISDSASAGGFWPLTKMTINNMDPPTFTMVRGSGDDDHVQLAKVQRRVVRVWSIDELSTLENDTYYIPEDPNFPLFDAFITNIDLTNKSAVLWILQITTSRLHRGATLGYRKIRAIIAILKDQLGTNPPPKKTPRTATTLKTPIQVRYLLVIPKGDDSKTKWRFPKGWSMDRSRNDHQGDVYGLEIPPLIDLAI